MNRFEKQARIDYLWNRIRVAVKTGLFVKRQMKQLNVIKHSEFDLVDDCDYVLSEG